jgi:two-component system response regulator AtoC
VTRQIHVNDTEFRNLSLLRARVWHDECQCRRAVRHTDELTTAAVRRSLAEARLGHSERHLDRTVKVFAPPQEPGELRAPPAPATTDTQPADLEWMFLNSARMRAVREVVERTATTDATVLISGASGVGKDVVARTLQQRSFRRYEPFVKVNCAALPLELLESELFGYERGAFTGAHQQKPGKFELAHTGTLFLDEIAEMPVPVQAKLLQVLQDGEFSRLGSRSDVRVDVRIIAATNKDLDTLAARGDFRRDLFYRLNVLRIHVPPLRERREELPVLAEYFVEQYSRQYGLPPRKVSARTLRCFLEYEWPGNVRELQNIIKRIVILGTEDWVAQELSLPSGPAMPSVEPASDSWQPHTFAQNGFVDLKEVARLAACEAERQALSEVLERVRWRRWEAAKRLKISSKTLRRKLQELGLDT